MKTAWHFGVSLLVVAGLFAWVPFFSAGRGDDVRPHTGVKEHALATVVDEGHAVLPARFNEELTVYYRIPYASPPKLIIKQAQHDYQITEQKADHFRIQNKTADKNDIKWKADGLPAREKHAVAANEEDETARGLFASLEKGQVVGVQLATTGYYIAPPGEPKELPGSLTYRGDFKVIEIARGYLVLETKKGDQELRIPFRAVVSVAMTKK
jgi:hypothetical protein